MLSSSWLILMIVLSMVGWILSVTTSLGRSDRYLLSVGGLAVATIVFLIYAMTLASSWYILWAMFLMGLIVYKTAGQMIKLLENK